MKKLVAVLLASLMLMSMAGCDKKELDSKDRDETDVEIEEENEETSQAEETTSAPLNDAQDDISDLNFTVEYGVVYDKGNVVISSKRVSYVENGVNSENGYCMVFDVQNNNDFTVQVDCDWAVVNGLQYRANACAVVAPGETNEMYLPLEPAYLSECTDYDCHNIGLIEIGVVLENFDEFTFVAEDSLDYEPDIVIETSLIDSYSEVTYSEGNEVLNENDVIITALTPFSDGSNMVIPYVISNEGINSVIVAGCGCVVNGEEDPTVSVNSYVYGGTITFGYIVIRDCTPDLLSNVTATVRLEGIGDMYGVYEFVIFEA